MRRALPLVESKVLAGLGLDALADGLDAAGQTAEDTLDVTALLHGDDPGLVLLVDPQEEGLGLVVEDAAALGPVALHTGDLQVPVSGNEEEVVVDQLLADLLVHAGQRVVRAGEVTGHLGQGVGHHLLDVNALLLGDSGGETESVEVASHPDPGGVDGHLGVDVSNNLEKHNKIKFVLI